jgi:peptide/nickel transport system substrate-binding protein
MIGLRKIAALAAVIWAALALPATAQTTLRMVPHADIKILDPVWTTALITRNFGYMVWDVLFAKDADLKIQPMMADHYTVSDDKLTYTIVLRDGLVWSDGTPITAEDCVASIKRWAARDTYGQLMMRDTAEIKAVDNKTFAIVLARPFGFVIDALAKVSSNVPFMMPKRIAATDPQKQITEFIGSGPFIFKQDEWKPGEKIVYVRNPRYQPRAEPPSMLAGAKIAKVDRVEWLAIPDPNTAMNALLAGEIDLIEAPPPDLFPIFKADKNVEIYGWNQAGSQIVMRLNWLHPPFNNVKIRQAAMYAIAQEPIMQAQVGDPAIYKLCNAPFICGTRFGKEYGDLLIKPDIEKAKALLKEGGYDDTPVLMMHQTDLASSNNVQPVVKQQLEKAGFKVDMVDMDWQSVVARRARREPPKEGGWNIFFTTNITLDSDNPGPHSYAAANCDKAWFGWPCDPEMEKLRDTFIHEPDPAKQKVLGEQIADRVYSEVMFVPVGQYKAFGAYRKDRVDGWLPGPVPVMWNVSKKN